MVIRRRVNQYRRGSQHPLPSTRFIQEHLARVGEDYPANILRAYLIRLDEIAQEKGKTKPYKHPSYQSFYMQVWKLHKAGVIEKSGRTEETDAPQFENWDARPERVYYRIAR